MDGYHLCFVDSLRTWGGAEVWILDTARRLHDAGYRVSVIAQPGAELLRRARAADLATAAIPIRFDGAPWTVARLARRFARDRVSAVVANLTKDLKAAAVAGRLVGVPAIFASRESDFPLKDKIYYRWYFNRLSSGVIVNSEATRRTVLASAPWLAAERVHLLYKGVDTRRFSPAASPPPRPPGSAVVVGFAGQLIPRKGLVDLQAAWDILQRTSAAPPRLRLAGQGPLADDLARWRAALPRPADVELLGHREDMVSFYRDIDILVLPSYSEGFGLAAAEAAACAVPVIATQASSLPEIVLHNRTGLLVPPGQPEALAAAVSVLGDDPDRRHDLGRAGRRHVQESFAQEIWLRKLLDLTGARARADNLC